MHDRLRGHCRGEALVLLRSELSRRCSTLPAANRGLAVGTEGNATNRSDRSGCFRASGVQVQGSDLMIRPRQRPQPASQPQAGHGQLSKERRGSMLVPACVGCGNDSKQTADSELIWRRRGADCGSDGMTSGAKAPCPPAHSQPCTKLRPTVPVPSDFQPNFARGIYPPFASAHSPYYAAQPTSAWSAATLLGWVSFQVDPQPRTRSGCCCDQLARF